MLGPRTLRDRSSSRGPEVRQESQSKKSVKGKGDDMATSSGWTEPALAQKPSYKETKGGSFYGVAEHMQPLGEAPSARVKTRVKADGARKSVLGKNAAALGLDAQDTPEGTPAPQAVQQDEVSAPVQPQIVVDDEDDGDYAPKSTGKKGNRAARARTVKQRGAATSKAAPKPSPVNVPKDKKYSGDRLRNIVEQAVIRAYDMGKPDLASAVHAIYIGSLSNQRLADLLDAILLQTATPEQTVEFQDYVRAAKKKLKDEKEGRKVPSNANGALSPLPLRSPSVAVKTENTSAIPSTEHLEPQKKKISLKVKSPSKDSGRRRSTNSAAMSPSPSKKRSGSVESDSSLTDMTSNPDDDMDIDEPDALDDKPASRPNGIKGKDHAAERGSLAAPNRGVKRASAEVEREEEERDRVLASKKAKLDATVTRDYPYQESNIRERPRASPARLRTLRGKNASLAPPPLSLATNGIRNTSTRGSRAVSTDLDSPLSELSPMSSHRSTPHVWRGPAKTIGKKAKTKTSPEKNHLARSSGMPGAGGAGRESPIGDDDNEELSDNNDFCSACGGSGFLLCCDGCDRSFHFACLDPPLNEDASELNEPWYCYICVAKRPVTAEQPEKPPRGLFAPLLTALRKRNPSNFALPQDIRDYFEGVATDRNGSFIEAVHTKTRNRPGYDEIPDFTKTKDNKGNTLLCYSCGKSSGGTRQIIQCDYCGENWHLDCLNPPLSNPPARTPEGKKLHDWMCPLHADHELRKVDTSLMIPPRARRRVHMRKPRNAKVTDASMRRGFRNNGVVEVIDDESDDTDSEFFDEEDPVEEGLVYRLPANGIKLDFIDKVKNTRVQELRNTHAHKKARLPSTAPAAPGALEQANFARRSFREKQMALNLVQFANENRDLDLGSDQVESLIGTLMAEAPTEVVDEMMAMETHHAEKGAWSAHSSAIPPSPPVSDQTDQLSTEQRKELQMLQELIRRRLESSKT